MQEMTDDTYNGWSNRETWAAHLWVTSDEGLYEMAREIVATADTPYEADGLIRDWLGGLLDHGEYLAEFGERQPEGLARMAADVGSLWRVNWKELVEAFTEEDDSDMPDPDDARKLRHEDEAIEAGPF